MIVIIGATGMEMLFLRYHLQRLFCIKCHCGQEPVTATVTNRMRAEAQSGASHRRTTSNIHCDARDFPHSSAVVNST